MAEVGKMFLGWIVLNNLGRWKIAEVYGKGVLVEIVKMIFWTSKGGKGIWKVTEVERIFGGNCKSACIHKWGCGNEGASTIL